MEITMLRYVVDHFPSFLDVGEYHRASFAKHSGTHTSGPSIFKHAAYLAEVLRNDAPNLRIHGGPNISESSRTSRRLPDERRLDLFGLLGLLTQ